MRKTGTYVISGIAVLVLMFVIINKNSDNISVGSVDRSNEYQYLVIANNLQGTSGTLCANTPGSLANVNITGAAASSLEFYDATTSNSARRSMTATTSLAKVASFPVSAAANSFTIDAIATSGLIWEVSSATAKATTTVSYRCF